MLRKESDGNEIYNLFDLSLYMLYLQKKNIQIL